MAKSSRPPPGSAGGAHGDGEHIPLMDSVNAWVLADPSREGLRPWLWFVTRIGAGISWVIRRGR